VWKILDPGIRRGPPSEAQALYEDLSPPPLPRETVPVVAQRDPGAGRPTKKHRRDIDGLMDD
jgi:ribosome-associated heat shock protein Hsp15